MTRISHALVLTLLAAAAAVGSGCYAGGARAFAPATFAREPGWISVTTVETIQQRGERDCGAAVAAMLLGYWGLDATQEGVRVASGAPPDQGLPAGFLRTYLRARGLDAYLLEGTFRDLAHELERGRPVLVGVNRPFATGKAYAHYQLVVGVHRARQRVVVIDPAAGWQEYSLADFDREWRPTRHLTIVASKP